MKPAFPGYDPPIDRGNQFDKTLMAACELTCMVYRLEDGILPEQIRENPIPHRMLLRASSLAVTTMELIAWAKQAEDNRWDDQYHDPEE